MIRGLYFVCISLLFFGSYAQQSCSQLLNRAEDLYREGKLLEIPGRISKCLEEPTQFTNEEQIRAYKLLTKVFIFTDNEADANAALINLLQVDPVHEIQAEDPSEMRVLMSKFRTWPIFRLEFRVGGNTNIQQIRQHFSVFPPSTIKGGEKSYHESTGLGLQIELDITRYLSKGIEAGVGLQYRQSSYNVNSQPKEQGFIFQTEIVNSQKMLRMPIFFRYNRNYQSREGFVPYVYLGFSLDYLLKAKYTKASRSGGTSFTLDNKDANLKDFDQVNNVNYSLFGGIGMKYHMKKGNFVFVEARFDKSLKLYNVPEERYSNPTINGDLLFVEDDLFLNFVSVNLGFIRSIFKPEKRTK